MMKEISCKKIGQVTRDGKFTVLDKNNKKIIDSNIKKMHKIYHAFSEKMK